MIKGFDVSRFSGNIDFQQAARSGEEFVICRCGGTLADGSTYTDANFSRYCDEAAAAGLLVGAYYYSRATTAAEVLKECEQIFKATKGRRLRMGIWIDVEETTALKALKNNYSTFIHKLLPCTLSFIGFTTYASAGNYLKNVEAPLWIANYTSKKYAIESDARVILHQTAGNVVAYGGTIDRDTF